MQAKHKILLFVLIGIIPAAICTYLFKTRVPTVRVAVLDTGVDLKDYPEILRKMAPNQMEKAERAYEKPVDNDKNGFLNDFVGWNFLDQSNDVTDRNGHGTLVSRIILDQEPRAFVIPIKIAKTLPSLTPDALAKGIRYAVSRRARIINISFGTREGSEELKAALEFAKERNVIVVTSARTDKNNRYDSAPKDYLYPRAYGNTLVVTDATNSDHPKANPDLIYSSPYGENYLPDEPLARGVSLATAVASGILAKLLYDNYKDMEKIDLAWVRNAISDGKVN